MSDILVDVESVVGDLAVEWVHNPISHRIPNGFNKGRWVGDNYMMCCPYHEENKPSFGIHRDPPYKFNCFTCGASGTISHLVEYVHEVNYMTAQRLLSGKYGYFPSDIDLSFLDEVDYEEDEEEDDSILTLEEELSKYREAYQPEYMWSRGILTEVAESYEIGLDGENNSIVFPVRNLQGGLEYFIKRRRDSKFYKIGEGADKINTLYGLNYLVGRTKEVYVVEGTIDVQSCYQAGLPAIALLGKSFSENAIILLQRAGIERVNMFMDNDKWGVRGNISAANTLSKTNIDVGIVKYPGKRWGIDTIGREIEYNDPNDLLVGEAMGEIKVLNHVEYMFDYACSKYHREVMSRE